MTRVPGDKQETATKKPDTTTSQHKPLPKGSDGSRPSARSPGEKPKPKRTGAIFDTVTRDPARAGGVDPLLYARGGRP